MKPIMFAALVLCSEPALADKCKGWIPTEPGVKFSGEVRHVIDGDSLCVGKEAGEWKWIEVRLADFRAPESDEAAGPVATSALKEVALGRQVQCVSVKGDRGNAVSWDRVIAVCTVDGKPVGDLLRAIKAPEGGK